MVDYRKASTSVTTLIIRDVDGMVSFWLEVNDSPSTWIGSASWSGKVNGVTVKGTYSWPAASGRVTRQIGGRWTVNKTQDVTFSIAATGTAGLGGPTSFTQRITRSAPGAPSSLNVTRQSDTQMYMTWTRNGTYTSFVVQRRLNNGSWQTVATVAGSANSYTDKTTKANGKYDYRVAVKNAAGQSGWSNTQTVYTTPAVPTGVSATRQGSGIRVDASGKPPHATSYDVRDGSTVVGSSVSLPWLHASPDPTVTHRYTVRAKRGSLTSAYSSASNTVQLLTPPNAPSNLSPNGATRDSAASVTFSWRHNPVDSSGQTTYELRHRPLGGAWTTLSGTTAQTRTITLPADDYEWQVRTKGDHPDWSAWSSIARVDVIDEPGVAITHPDGLWQSSTVPVEWTFFQAQDRPQSSWQVELLDSSLTVIEARSGQGAATSTTFTSRVTQGEWTVRVRVGAGGIWSEWEEVDFEVLFDPPAEPSITAVWDEEQGGVVIDVEPGDDPDLPDTVALVVERSLDEETWEFVAEVPEATTLIDGQSLTYGETFYRVNALTVENATTSAYTSVEVWSDAVWLSCGEDYELTARLPLTPKVSISAGRERITREWAGRPLPVAYHGETVSRTVSVSGQITDRDLGVPGTETANVARMIQVAQADTSKFLLRTPDRERLYGSIGDVSMPREFAGDHPDGFNGWWGYSFTISEAVRP